jgi:ABC-type uncharacterized transport system permease subunit
MTSSILFPLAGILTALCAVLLWANVWHLMPDWLARRTHILVAVTIPLTMVLTFWGWTALESFNATGFLFTLSTAVAISTLLVQGIYFVGALRHRHGGLGLFVLPVIAVPLILLPFLPHDATTEWIQTRSLLETGHMIISLCGYAVLTLSALHAVMLWQLDRALKRKSISPLIEAMPSIIEIEAHMMAQLRLAAWLIGISLMTGLAWQWEAFSHLRLISHKVLLAIFSWIVIMVPLIRRSRASMHGRKSAIMVITAYILLLLAYFGVKMIKAWLHH